MKKITAADCLKKYLKVKVPAAYECLNHLLKTMYDNAKLEVLTCQIPPDLSNDPKNAENRKIFKQIVTNLGFYVLFSDELEVESPITTNYLQISCFEKKDI